MPPALADGGRLTAGGGRGVGGWRAGGDGGEPVYLGSGVPSYHYTGRALADPAPVGGCASSGITPF